MSKDKACISAVKEVCQRCHLYKENCEMLDYPDQCSTSGRYVDGYRQAEKDLELTWEDLALIRLAFDAIEANIHLGAIKIQPMTKEYYQEVLKRFNKERREK